MAQAARDEFAGFKPAPLSPEIRGANADAGADEFAGFQPAAEGGAIQPDQPQSVPMPSNGVPEPHPLMLVPGGADLSTTVGDAKIGDWQDLLPKRPVSKLSPQDEATLNGLYRSGTGEQITQFLASRGYYADPHQNELFAAQRDKARAQGGKVNYGISYALPKIHNADGAVGAAARGAGRGGTADFLDEAGAVVDSLGGTSGRENIWNSDRSFGDLYNRNVDQNRAILSADDEDHPYASLAGEIVGGLAVPLVGEGVGLTRGISTVAQDSYRAARLEGFTADEARTIAQKTVARRLAKEGAAYGGAYGAGSADGDTSERLLGAATGAAEGGLLGRALGFVGEHLAPSLYASRVAGRALPVAEPSEAALVGKAAKRQGVAILPQDVGGPGIARATQGAAQTTFGAKVIGDAADRLYDSFSGRVGELAGDALSPKDAGNIIGERAADVARRGALAADQTSGAVESALATPSDGTGAGQLIQRGVSRFMDDTADRASALYDQVPIRPEQPAQLSSTRRLLGDLTDEWASNPKLGAQFQNSKLSRFLNALTPETTPVFDRSMSGVGVPPRVIGTTERGGQLSWSDLSEFRTRVGDMLSDPNLTEKIAPRQLRALYGAVTTDMEATARDAGPEALARWKRANAFYNGRMKRINDTFSLVVGKKGDATPNEAFATMQAMLKPGPTGNASAFARIMRSLSHEDASAVRASIVDEARGGRQFDPDRFAKSWSQLSERGKSALLPQPGMRVMMDDAAGRAALDSRNPFAGMSGEQIFAKLDAMASNRGDSNRFAATMARLSPDEANAVRSTFIHQGGRALPGSQNAAGDAFSISRWLTRWNTMTPEAKAVLFGRGELRSAMEDLATVAEHVKASERLAGHSNTGAVNNFNATTGGLYGAVQSLVAGTVTGHPLLGLAGAVSLASPAAYQRISAEILTSPRLLRWLTRVPKQADRAGQLAYLSKLSTIAAREPAIADNVLDLKEFLRAAISKSPDKAAAQDEGDSRKKIPDQRGGNNGKQ